MSLVTDLGIQNRPSVSYKLANTASTTEMLYQKRILYLARDLTERNRMVCAPHVERGRSSKSMAQSSNNCIFPFVAQTMLLYRHVTMGTCFLQAIHQ